MKKRLLFILFLIILYSAPGAIYGLDAPHNASDPTKVSVTCSKCHYTSSNTPSWATQTTPVNTTKMNLLCASCHNDVTLGASDYGQVVTHSSYETTTRYGTWLMECRTCHDPHYQAQLRSYPTDTNAVMASGTVSSIAAGTTSTVTVSNALSAYTYTNHLLIPNTTYPTYMYRIKGNTGNTITVWGKINTTYAGSGKTYNIKYGNMVKNQIVTTASGTNTVKFLKDEGKNSFADNDSTYDGVCQVCHTKTSFFRKDGSKTDSGHPEVPATSNATGTGAANKDCAACHKHKDGFKANCSTCHGYPPLAGFQGSGGLAENEDGTGSVTPGAHEKHVKSIGYACSTCHTGGMPATAIYDKKIQIGFNVLGGTYQTGTYDGRATLLNGYSYTAGNVGTSVSAGGGMQCSNIYCHGSTMNPNAGSNITPLWNDTNTAVCGTCHGASAAAPPTRGSHEKHAGNTSSLQSSVACTICHKDYSHVNNKADWKFDSSDTRVSAGKYNGVSSGSATMASFPKTYSSCSDLYCHSNAAPTGTLTPNEYKTVTWGDTTPMDCTSCHKGRTADNPTMSSNGHERLVGDAWVRQYPCSHCHYDTVDSSGAIKDKSKHLNGMKDVSMDPQWNIPDRPVSSYTQSTGCSNVYCHSDGTTNPETVRPFKWTDGKTSCNTCHGHSQGTCGNSSCHDNRTDVNGKFWAAFCSGITQETCEANGGTWSGGICRGLSESTCNSLSGSTGWPSGQEWKAAMPMFPNQGAGSDRANSHPRHLETDFQCDVCHYKTIVNGTCTDCHQNGIPSGNMSQQAHINAEYHVKNKAKDVYFKDGGTYNNSSRSCSNTACHTGGVAPVWGGSVDNTIICLDCHGTSGSDVDDFGSFNSSRAKISQTEWINTGHGRHAGSGNYSSGNPAADFPTNPCWYCHDNNVIHKDDNNPFRLRRHHQFDVRFEKECVYCHMEGKNSECVGCHNSAESMAPQLSTLAAKDDDMRADKVTPAPRPSHTVFNNSTSCLASGCHGTSGDYTPVDSWVHSTESGTWTPALKADVKNQYIMMGACLKCHEEDSNGRCTQCHTSPPENPNKYSLGFDPGTGLIKPQKARATSVHYGYKHFQLHSSLTSSKGGKFCWDCHDPHGDGNIFMIQNKVATLTDGKFGVPVTRQAVSFTKKTTGSDYADSGTPTAGQVHDGICNVCHTQGSQHYRIDYGDGHNSGRICTNCHEHRFSSSHASDKSCGACHKYKPVPSHTGFGLPRDCTKCHEGVVGKRMDIMGQLRSNSHHIQRSTGTTGEIKNTDCYICHWEATKYGLIDVDYHEGYNFKTHETKKNEKVDLVILGAETRPTTTYELGVTAIQFLASNIGTTLERSAVAGISTHCLSCHSDQNNDWSPFGDCKTPRQYAWDRSSVASRYSNTGATTWGKYSAYSNAAKKNQTKAFSAHGNATTNAGGWSSSTGVDGDLSAINTRNGAQNVQCYDCHSSHGSKTSGTTSSYVTYNGTMNGGNLKETQAGKGGYNIGYKAVAKTTGINPYNAGAGQCFDCHETSNGYNITSNPTGTTPWGYLSTFEASGAIMGYKDTPRFGAGTKGSKTRYSFFKEITDSGSNMGGHFKHSSTLSSTPTGQINGLCTPCHDPHGVSRSLGSDMAYAVPLLKGTWMTSPYKEDVAMDGATSGARSGRPTGTSVMSYVYTDERTFGTGNWISEDDSKFGGLCLRCHPKSSLTDGVTHTWKNKNRVHESVKGWKTANATIQHNYSCSKCHQPHVSGLPRLMQTNCLDTNHRGRVTSGGIVSNTGGGYPYERPFGTAPYGWIYAAGSFPKGFSGNNSYANYKSNCHPAGTWPDNSWNSVTQW